MGAPDPDPLIGTWEDIDHARSSNAIQSPDGGDLTRAHSHIAAIPRRAGSVDDAPVHDAQIERLLAASIGITHIDGHQHIHVFPAVLQIVADAAKGHGIRRMRIPDETVAPGCDDVRPDLLEEARRFAALGKAARKACQAVVRNSAVSM